MCLGLWMLFLKSFLLDCKFFEVFYFFYIVQAQIVSEDDKYWLNSCIFVTKIPQNKNRKYQRCVQHGWGYKVIWFQNYIHWTMVPWWEKIALESELVTMRWFSPWKMSSVQSDLGIIFYWYPLKSLEIVGHL